MQSVRFKISPRYFWRIPFIFTSKNWPIALNHFQSIFLISNLIIDITAEMGMDSRTCQASNLHWVYFNFKKALSLKICINHGIYEGSPISIVGLFKYRYFQWMPGQPVWENRTSCNRLKLNLRGFFCFSILTLSLLKPFVSAFATSATQC